VHRMLATGVTAHRLVCQNDWPCVAHPPPPSPHLFSPQFQESNFATAFASPWLWRLHLLFCPHPPNRGIAPFSQHRAHACERRKLGVETFFALSSAGVVWREGRTEDTQTVNCRAARFLNTHGRVCASWWVRRVGENRGHPNRKLPRGEISQYARTRLRDLAGPAGFFMRSARGVAGDGAPTGGWARTLRQMGVCARRNSTQRGHNGGGRLDDGPG
jgi:hypothetical protein